MPSDPSRPRQSLLSLRWMAAHVVVAIVASGFVALGLWQLDRHEQRRAGNETAEARLGMPAVPFDELLAYTGVELESIRYRRATVRGVFDPENEVLVRSQVHLGVAGFHVVTPLVMSDGTAVLVNRGWVPLGMDSPPVGEEAAPPADEITVEGWVELSRERPFFGPEDPPEGKLPIVSRVDVLRIANQVPYQLAPVYLVMAGGGEGILPAVVREPLFDDAGPHLGYAIQWFAFAIVATVGYVFLARRRSGQSASTARSSTTS